MTGRADIFMITYNRTEYVRRSLPRLLETCRDQDRVWIWQNGTHGETVDAVREHEGHPKIARVHFSDANLKLREPTNWFWANATAPFLGKVDDDCLVPHGWIERLIAIHRDADRAGVLSCWPFLEEDLDEALVARKTVELAGHSVMANPWVGGAGYIMKRACLERCGLLGDTEGFTTYCLRVCRAGWTVGWPMPPLIMDHMDDPRSAHTVFKTDEDVLAHRGLTAAWRGIDTVEGMTARVKEAARELQTCSGDWRDYLGWRAKFRRAIRKLKP
jgi:GT2 family glycosyltransferase